MLAFYCKYRGYKTMIRHEKIAICRESLFELTGGLAAAIVLNQFIYWAKCKAEADAMYAKEIKAYENEHGELDFKLTYGWVYKSADELAEETMLGISRTSIRRIVKQLVDKGYIMERRNPNYTWDRTYQYNVNFVLIQRDLLKLGYSLDGYTIGRSINLNASNKEAESIVPESKNIERTKANNRMSIREQSNVQKSTFKDSKIDIQMYANERAIPEITTEITTENKEREYRESAELQGTHSLSQPLTQRQYNLDCFNPDMVTPEQAELREQYFNKFWQLYPRRANKLKARIAWQVLPCDVELYERILQSVELYKQSRQWQDACFIPYPETYLQNEKWEDDIPIPTDDDTMPF